MTAPVIEHHHADVSGGWLRAATFGAMDGLVTNDRKRTAQFEHTVLVTADGHEILTLP